MDEGHVEEDAVALADQAVLDSQGGGQAKDLAQVQRGGSLMKLFTNFYSFFNTTWNLSVESTKRSDFRDPASVARLAGDYLLLYTVPVVLMMALREALRGSDDDDDDLPERFAREQLSYLLGMTVATRDMAIFVRGFDYSGPAGLRFYSALGKLVKQVEQGDADMPLFHAANQTAGILFHYPAGMVQRVVDGFASEEESRTGLRAMLFGPPYR